MTQRKKVEEAWTDLYLTVEEIKMGVPAAPQVWTRDDPQLVAFEKYLKGLSSLSKALIANIKTIRDEIVRENGEIPGIPKLTEQEVEILRFLYRKTEEQPKEARVYGEFELPKRFRGHYDCLVRLGLITMALHRRPRFWLNMDATTKSVLAKYAIPGEVKCL